MSFDHSSHRMIFRTRLTGRWSQLGGLIPFRHHRHRQTTRHRDGQLLLEAMLVALLFLWSVLLTVEALIFHQAG